MTIDLRRGFCEAFAICGGFLIAIYFICNAFVVACTRYEGEKYIADQLYVYNAKETNATPVLDRSGDVKTAVNSQYHNNMSAFEWLFCCCCTGSAGRRHAFE